MKIGREPHAVRRGLVVSCDVYWISAVGGVELEPALEVKLLAESSTLMLLERGQVVAE